MCRGTFSSIQFGILKRTFTPVTKMQQQHAASESLPDDDRLNGLPLELQLHIANAVGERCDRAALILASPRLLGLAACRQLPSYQGLEMSLLVGGAIDEKALRWYASRAEATPEGCKWLAGVAAAAGLPKCKIIVWPPRFHPVPWHQHHRGTEQRWFLMQPDSTCGALLQLRRGAPQVRTIRYYEGEEGAERVVRIEPPNGMVKHLEGEKGAERVVRGELPGGEVRHFEGEKGAERLVRVEVPGGTVQHYFQDSMVQHFEGEKGAERVVRVEVPGTAVLNFEGEKGAERLMRLEMPIGTVQHCEGEKGAERVVRRELLCGTVEVFEGEKGAERLVRIELPFGGVIHFDGETGARSIRGSE